MSSRIPISPDYISQAVALRHQLHRQPELSGNEVETAVRIVSVVRTANPDLIEVGLGGHGVAVVFEGGKPGPGVLVRAEIDALSIEEAPEKQEERRSLVPGVAHLCGHDGHASALALMGLHLGQHKPRRGRVVLLFQPAEETGQGAKAVANDARWQSIEPDFALAWHNLPGFPVGQVVACPGTMCCASTGLMLRWEGSTAHAAYPQAGMGAAGAAAGLASSIATQPIPESMHGDAVMATLVGVRSNSQDFGIMPGGAEVALTIRATTSELLEARVIELCRQGDALGQAHGLRCSTRRVEAFDATMNDESLFALAQQVAAQRGMRWHTPTEPMRWSDDFGTFSQRMPSLYIGIGAGEQTMPLHDPGYAFPDALIEAGAGLMLDLVDAVTGSV